MARRPLLAIAAWIVLGLTAIAGAQGIAGAQEADANLQRAIEVAARHPLLAASLAQYPGWTASGYDAQDRYGLWRVDFSAADGQPLAWAQVRLADERVFAWEVHVGVEGDQAYAEAEAALLAFLRQDPEFRAFGGDPDEHDWTWLGYDTWRDVWYIHLERGADSLAVVLRSDHAWSRSLEDLRIVQIQVPAVVGVEDWRSMRGSDAISLAFGEPSVAAAVRGLDGWTTEVEALDRSVWRVRFLWEGQTVAEADVDLAAGLVVVREAAIRR